MKEDRCKTCRLFLRKDMDDHYMHQDFRSPNAKLFLKPLEPQTRENCCRVELAVMPLCPLVR